MHSFLKECIDSLADSPHIGTGNTESFGMIKCSICDLCSGLKLVENLRLLHKSLSRDGLLIFLIGVSFNHYSRVEINNLL